jgi:hypothetical protein
LKAFVAAWHPPLGKGDGVPVEELDAAEERLGVALPVALREWYQLAGRRADITATQNILLSPDQLSLEPTVPDGEGRVLVFHVENQGVVRWGILLRDFDLPDPPVVLDATGWQVENQHVSEFALQMVVFETTMGSDYYGWGWADRTVLKVIERTYEDSGFPVWHWPMEGRWLMRFFSRPHVLMQTAEDPSEDYVEVHIAARTAALYEEAVSLLDIHWDYHWNRP